MFYLDPMRFVYTPFGARRVNSIQKDGVQVLGVGELGSISLIGRVKVESEILRAVGGELFFPPNQQILWVTKDKEVKAITLSENIIQPSKLLFSPKKKLDYFNPFKPNTSPFKLGQMGMLDSAIHDSRIKGAYSIKSHPSLKQLIFEHIEGRVSKLRWKLVDGYSRWSFRFDGDFEELYPKKENLLRMSIKNRERLAEGLVFYKERTGSTCNILDLNQRLTPCVPEEQALFSSIGSQIYYGSACYHLSPILNSTRFTCPITGQILDNWKDISDYFNELIPNTDLIPNWITGRKFGGVREFWVFGGNLSTLYYDNVVLSNS